METLMFKGPFLPIFSVRLEFAYGMVNNLKQTFEGIKLCRHFLSEILEVGRLNHV